MKNNINEQKLKNYKLRKKLRIIIIILLIMTIVLSILSILNIVNVIWAIICFIISNIISRYRNNLVINDEKKKK